MDGSIGSILLDKETAGSFLSCFTIKGRDGATFNISHLLFADDSLVFCTDSEDQVLYISGILLCFEALSGLKVNFERSAIFSSWRG